MKNEITTTKKISDVHEFNKVLSAVRSMERAAGRGYKILAIAAVEFATAAGGSNLDPLNRLYNALSPINGGQGQRQKALLAFVRQWAPFIEFKAENGRFRLKRIKNRKSGKYTPIAVEKRVLREGFKPSLDFTKSLPTGSGKNNGDGAKKAPTPRAAIKSIKSAAEKAAEAAKAADSSEKLDIYSPLLDALFSIVPHHLIAARLAAEESKGKPLVLEGELLDKAE